MSDLETVNKLYLELSNIATAKTAKELKLEKSNKELLEALKHLYHNARKSGAEMGLALDVAREAITNAGEMK